MTLGQQWTASITLKAAAHWETNVPSDIARSVHLHIVMLLVLVCCFTVGSLIVAYNAEGCVVCRTNLTQQPELQQSPTLYSSHVIST